MERTLKQMVMSVYVCVVYVWMRVQVSVGAGLGVRRGCCVACLGALTFHSLC